jgi:uncharacterized repeat protein (TIGR03803 family)
VKNIPHPRIGRSTIGLSGIIASLAFVTTLVSVLIPPQSAQATSLMTLYSFCSKPGCTDGSLANGLIQATDGNIYGTTQDGGANCLGCGTVFKLASSGKLTTLYSFCSQAYCSDGQNPTGVIQATDGYLYGTTISGGAHGNNGTVFKITPSGTLTTLYSMFKISRSPDRPLIQGTNGNFYGNTGAGGQNFDGSIYKITPSGKLTTLYSFCSQSGCPDGSFPNGLIQASNGSLYGTTAEGGVTSSSCALGCGTVFEITPSGTLTTLYRFCSQSGCPDGHFSLSEVIQATDGNFYGTTNGGGAHGDNGTVFKITPSGTLTTLHSFCSQTNSQGNCLDGANPIAGLIQATDGNLYGFTQYGGANSTSCNLGCGTVFKITPGGTLTRLYSFCSQINCTDGNAPGTLMQDTDGNFYGTTSGGGAKKSGTIFSLSVGLGPFVKTQTTSGEVGAAIKILGTDLTGSTDVTFNGTVAKFKVVSASEITTTVPAGATTGFVKVATPDGTLTSNGEFVVKP